MSVAVELRVAGQLLEGEMVIKGKAGCWARRRRSAQVRPVRIIRSPQVSEVRADQI
jgi:hypothetical protein